MVCDKVVCERSCAKDGVCQRWCVPKMVCDKVVCERWSVTACERWCVAKWCERWCVKDGVSKMVCQRWCVKDGV